MILLAYVGVINPPHLKCCMKVGKSNKSCLKFLYPDLSTARSPPAGITICWGEVRTEWTTCTSNLTSASKIISHIYETLFLYWPIGVWCSSKGNRRPDTGKIWAPMFFCSQNAGHFPVKIVTMSTHGWGTWRWWQPLVSIQIKWPHNMNMEMVLLKISL